MIKSSNTHKHEPPPILGTKPLCSAAGVFRKLMAMSGFEVSPVIHSEKLLIIFANIRV